jgi:hypothetical protein
MTDVTLGDYVRLKQELMTGFEYWRAGTMGEVVDRWDSSGFRFANVRVVGRTELMTLDLDADTWERV